MATENKKADKPKKARRFHPVRYFKEVIAELKKLTWPTRKDLIAQTLTVLAFVAAMAVVIGLLDTAFNGIVQLLTNIGA